jgi:acetyltransferase-like isoleucine patch superfamily enzyme
MAPTTLPRRFDDEVITGGPNAHQRWYRVRDASDGPVLGPLRIVANYLLIYAAHHLPSLALKRFLFRRVLGMKLGTGVTIASGATLDYFFPELIEIGDHTIVGMDALILTHEFLPDRWRRGRVVIGANVLIGARSVILAGVEIGARSVIAAGSVVNRSLPEAICAAGNPIAIVRGRRAKDSGTTTNTSVSHSDDRSAPTPARVSEPGQLL